MKNGICILLTICLLLCSLAFSGVAISSETEVTREYLENGDYIEIGIGNPVENESFSVFERLLEFLRKLMAFFTGNNTVKKTKYASYFDANGTLLWTVYLTGEFVYNSKSSACRSVSTNTEVSDRDWTVLSAQAKRSENVASADFTLQQSKLGVKLKTVSRYLSITCDKDGNIQ